MQWTYEIQKDRWLHFQFDQTDAEQCIPLFKSQKITALLSFLGTASENSSVIFLENEQTLEFEDSILGISFEGDYAYDLGDFPFCLNASVVLPMKSYRRIRTDRILLNEGKMLSLQIWSDDFVMAWVKWVNWSGVSIALVTEISSFLWKLG